MTTTIGRPLQAASTPFRKLELRQPKERRLLSEPVEDRTWVYYDNLGAIGNYVTVLSNSAGLVSYYPATVEVDEAEPVQSEDAEVLSVWETVGGEAQVSTWVAELVVHLSVPGQAWFVPLLGEKLAPEAEQADDVTWHILSTFELRRLLGITEADRIPDDDNRIWRIFNPHPQDGRKADSPVRRVKAECELLMLIKRRRISDMQARVFAGILLLPDSLKAERTTSGKLFADVLEESMIEAITVQESTSSRIPEMLYAAKDELAAIRLMSLAVDDPERINDLEDRTLRSLALGIDAPQELTTGIGTMNHWCSDSQTEALTVDGWKWHDELIIGDIVLTLNHETGLSEWQPVLDIYRADVVDELMLAMSSRNHSSLTTAAHRWPIYDVIAQARRWKTSDRLASHDRIITSAPNADLPTEAKYADDLVELVAWLWTEGHISGSAVSISQSHTKNPDRVLRIRAALLRLFGASRDSLRANRHIPGWREKVQSNESSFGGPVTVFYLNTKASEVLLAHAPNKDVSLNFVRTLTRSQLELFIDVSVQGDGHHSRRDLEIWQKNEGDLAAYEMALVLSGRMVLLVPSHDDGYRVGVWKQSWVAPHKAGRQQAGAATAEWRPYSGVVWCPTTPNGTWFARREGKSYFTGNSAWLIQEQTYTQHLDPLVLRILHSLDPWWQSQLEANGADPSGQVLWRNPATAIRRPNQADQIAAGYDRMAVSDETYLRSIDLTLEDRPDDDELERRLLIRLLSSPQALSLVPGLASAAEALTGPAQLANPAVGDTSPEALPVIQAQTDDEDDALLLAAVARELTRIDATALLRMEQEAARQINRLRRTLLDRIAAKAKERGLDVGDRETLPVRLGPNVVSELIPGNLSDPEDFAAGPFAGVLYDAQIETAAVLGRLGLTRDATVDADDGRSAVIGLLGGLSAALISSLFRRPSQVGEVGIDGAEFVPVDLLRTALDTAGGGLAGRAGGEIWSGVGNGRRTLDLLSSIRIETERYKWIYGVAPRKTFEPHLRLDGVTFDDSEDEKLRQGEDASWVGGEFFFPSDHAGCLCLLERVLIRAAA